MNLTSNWKLTYDPDGTPKVILAFDQEFLREPRYQLRRGLEVIPIPDAVPFLRPTLADVYDYSVLMVFSASTDAVARKNMMEELLDSAGRTRKPVRLDIAGQTDRYYQWASVFIHLSAVERLTTEAVAGAWVLEMAFTAVGFSKTTIP